MKNKILLLVSTLIVSVTTYAIVHPSYAYENKISAEVKNEFARQLDCMAKNIYYEAASEPFEGKVAVAQVTMNRTRNKNYPSDICSVVTQKTNGVCQFSWFCENVKITKEKYTWEESKHVAKLVLTNQLKHDNIAKHNVLFFHADYVDASWTKGYKKVAKIGRHIFYSRV